MLKTIIPDESAIITLAGSLRRDQLPLHEHTLLSTESLIRYFIAHQTNLIGNPGSCILSVVDSGKVYGYISCSLNEFDSGIFGFPCYQVNEIIVNESGTIKTWEIINSMLDGLKKTLLAKKGSFYLLFSLSNNTSESGSILNALVSSGCYYIHTLLTFCSKGERFDVPRPDNKLSLKIRIAGKEDAENVASLAKRSFKYSRFHLDPFLDKGKADYLHSVSAYNSLASGFSDIMFVAENNNKIIGYYSGKKHYYNELGVTVGKAIISAVDDSFRGFGIFNILDSSLLNWFADNTDFSEMGTYLINYPVHRTWIKKGIPLVRATHQISAFIKE